MFHYIPCFLLCSETLFLNVRNLLNNSYNYFILILHAEDQLMSAEGFKIVALEFIDVYKKFFYTK